MRWGFGIAGILMGAVGAWGQAVPGNTATSINVQTLQTGTVLSVSTAVSPDRRYVGMAMSPQFSVLDGVDMFVITNNASAAAARGIAGNGMPQAVALRRPLFRPAVVGRVTLVDNDKTLLAVRVKGAEWKDVSLKNAVRRLADATKQNMVLGIRGLEQAGVDVNTGRDFRYADGTVKEALLALLQTGAGEIDMVIDSTDKVIQIATQAQADQVLITRTYFLEDLLAGVPRWVAGGTDLNAIGGGVAPHESGLERAAADFRKSLDLSVPPVEMPARPVKKASTEKAGPMNILELITDAVRPEIWKNHGGKSELYMVGNRVTVKAPASVHAILDGPKVHNPNRVDSYVNYGG